MSEYTIPWDTLPEVSEKKKTRLITGLQLPETATIKEKNLIFYPGFTLLQVEIASLDSKPEVQFFIWGHDKFIFIQLDWTSSPIFESNEKVQLKLNKDTVKEYLRFFCDFVCGDDGPFTMIEGFGSPRFERKYQQYIDQAKFHIEGQDAPVEGKDLSDEQKQAILEKIKPMEIEEKNSEFRVAVCLWYGTRLFEVKIEAQADGIVEMMDDFPLLELSSTGATPWHDEQKIANGQSG